MQKGVDTIVHIGALLPERVIIQKMNEATKNWLDNPTGDNKNYLMMLCLMMMSQEAASTHSEGVEGLMKHLEQEEQLRQMIDPKRHES